MKKIKKFMALALALVMCMSMMSMVAFAQDLITISVDNSGQSDENTAAEVYSAYKIFDVVKAASISGSVTTDDSIAAQTPAEGASYTPAPGFAYTIAKNSPWYDVVKNNLSDYITLTPSAGDTENEVVELKKNVPNNENTAITMAAILEQNIPDNATAINVSLGSDATNVDPGYYLIVSSIGSNLILGTSDIEITQKNTYPTIEKLQKDEDTAVYTDTAVDVAVGDTIDYQVTVNVPASAKVDITVTDTMFAGLTYDQTTGLTVKADNKALAVNSDYVVGDATPTSWILTLKPTDSTKGKDVVITFKATVNKDSINVNDASKKNSVRLDFSNFRQTDEVNYKTNASAIFKYDGATEWNDKNVKKLKGVKFTLEETTPGTEASGDVEATEAVTKKFTVTKHNDGYYYYDANGSSEVVTDQDGMIVIRGLDGDKTYTLTETETNQGYNLLEGPATLNLVADTNVYSADSTSAQSNIANNQGSVLPSTGGIGTTIFYIIGAILVIGAGVVLVTRRRMNVQ
ncbi:MAG: isopeptide-forming domain-containing fimbrial protein [Anaerovoracaceae bacterium]